MSEEFFDFDCAIDEIFKEYTENTNHAHEYIDRIMKLKTDSLLEEFYKYYILNLIYINIEQFDMVLDNAKNCLSIYENLDKFAKSKYSSEVLLARYYAIFLAGYFHKTENIDSQLEELRKEILPHKKNSILNDLLNKIDIYFYTKADNNSSKLMFENLIKDLNFKDFNYFCEKTASKIFSVDDSLKFLSHYTSIEKSFNILDKEKLWVSRHDFLNDKSELKYINNVLKEIINDFNDNKIPQFNDEEIVFMRNQIQIVEKIISYFIGDLNYNILSENEKYLVSTIKRYYFVLSFSKNKDSLSLWGNYTEFNGINLLFDKDKITTFLNEKKEENKFLYFIKQNYNKDKELYSTFYYGEVLYDLKIIKKQLISDYRKTLDLHLINSKILIESVVTRILIELTLIRRLFAKVNYFSCEEEYRFVFCLDEDLYNQKVSFRCAKDNYIPYISIPIQLENLEEIIVGPRNNSDLVIKGFKEYLNYKNKNLIININKSQIPFR